MLPYGVLDLAKSAADARRSDRMAGIYHLGQSVAWDGRRVLDDLVKRHGGIHIAENHKQPLREVFGDIMWGELAAWKISAQLADRIEPLGAKMAATSQAHDEARHFYVMHDYLVAATGVPPGRANAATERLLGSVLEENDLACKLLGMQLQVETTALTLFQHARETRICPVLSDLLLYYEKDEARHVGLGMQYLPTLVRAMGRVHKMRFTAFALKVTLYLIAMNRAMEPSLRALGLDPRTVLRLAKSKQLLVFEDLWAATPGSRSVVGNRLSVLMEATADAMWPSAENDSPLGRVRAFTHALQNDGVAPVATSIHPEG